MDKPLAGPRPKGGAALQALRLCDRRRLLFDSKVLGPAIQLWTSKGSRRRIFGRYWVTLSFVFSPRPGGGQAGSAQSRLTPPVSAVCFFATRPDQSENASAGGTTENAQNVFRRFEPFDCDQISPEAAAADAGWRRHLLARISHFSHSPSA